MHQKNSTWCWLYCNLDQFDAKKSGSTFFPQPFCRGRFQFCKYSHPAMRGMNNRWVAAERGVVVGAGWWVAGWQGGRAKVMGGVERWRGVWWGLDGMEGDGAIRTRRTLILVKCKNYLAIITRLLSSSLFRNFSTQQYIHIFTISTLIQVKCKKITQRLTRQLSSSLFQTFDLSTRYAGRKKYKNTSFSI